MGQRSTPPLPMVASGNQVSAEDILAVDELLLNLILKRRMGKRCCLTPSPKMSPPPSCSITIDGNGGAQDGTAQCKPDSESVFVSGAISRSWTRCWTSSAWDCSTWHTDKHGTGTMAGSGNECFFAPNLLPILISLSFLSTFVHPLQSEDTDRHSSLSSSR